MGGTVPRRAGGWTKRWRNPGNGRPGVGRSGEARCGRRGGPPAPSGRAAPGEVVGKRVAVLRRACAVAATTGTRLTVGLVRAATRGSARVTVAVPGRDPTPVSKPGVLTCRKFMAARYKLVIAVRVAGRRCLCRLRINYVEAAEWTHA